MPPNFGFIAHTTETHANELTAERARNALSEARFTDARRAVEAQDRGFHVPLQLQDSQVLQYPLLDLLEAVVVLIEHFFGTLDVEVVLGILQPREVEYPINVVARNGIIWSRRVGAGQLVQFFLEGLSDVIRELLLLGPLPQLTDLGSSAFALSELILDSLHLLAQKVFALLLVDIRLDLGTNLLGELQHLEFAVQCRHYLLGAIHESPRFK